MFILDTDWRLVRARYVPENRSRYGFNLRIIFIRYHDSIGVVTRILTEVENMHGFHRGSIDDK